MFIDGGDWGGGHQCWFKCPHLSQQTFGLYYERKNWRGGEGRGGQL